MRAPRVLAFKFPMKLGLKIPLAFAAALLLMIAGALYGIFKLNESIDTYRTVVANNVAAERMVSQTLITFKLQVQEWKDTLLRGKDPAKLDKYWTAFQTREQSVRKLANEKLDVNKAAASAGPKRSQYSREVSFLKDEVSMLRKRTDQRTAILFYLLRVTFNL